MSKISKKSVITKSNTYIPSVIKVPLEIDSDKADDIKTANGKKINEFMTPAIAKPLC